MRGLARRLLALGVEYVAQRHHDESEKHVYLLLCGYPRWMPQRGVPEQHTRVQESRRNRRKR